MNAAVSRAVASYPRLHRWSCSAIATLVERQSRFLLPVELGQGRLAGQVRGAGRQDHPAARAAHTVADLGSGKEMADHVGSTRFTVATGVQVDFCDLRSPWQRAMKHTNGLLPEDFPKRSDLGVHDQAHLDAVAAELNGRPRQTPVG